MSNIINNLKKKLPLDKFINLCLYKHKNSYYEKNKIFGRRGDFITSPYISSIFGEIISIYILNYFSKRGVKKFNLLEIGAGEGVMAKDIIKTLQKFEKFKFEYFIEEKSKNLKKIQQKNLKKLKVKWINNFKKINKNNLFILSNELLDSFPVKHLKKIHNRWHERNVFFDMKKKELTSDYFKLKKIPKNIFNFCTKGVKFIEYPPEIFKFINRICKLIKNHKNNCFMTIDYGYYDDNFKNTLQALKKHQKVSIFHEPGNTDITHLVNFKFISRILKKNGLTRTLNMSQSDFLIKYGILLRLEQAKKSLTSKKNKIKLNMAVNRLIDSQKMGNLFKVLLVTNEN
tara:strand:+ start:5624 stop:6652 length:1029 start_codon:yes stop_codon:yes gene_type:complete